MSKKKRYGNYLSLTKIQRLVSNGAIFTDMRRPKVYETKSRRPWTVYPVTVIETTIGRAGIPHKSKKKFIIGQSGRDYLLKTDSIER